MIGNYLPLAGHGASGDGSSKPAASIRGASLYRIEFSRFIKHVLKGPLEALNELIFLAAVYYGP